MVVCMPASLSVCHGSDASSLKHVLESWWAWVHHELSLGKLEMRLLSAAAYLTSHLPLRFVPLLNRILIAPLFHGLAGRGGSVFVKEGKEQDELHSSLSHPKLSCRACMLWLVSGYAGLILDDHPDNYQETEWFVHIDDFEAVRESAIRHHHARSIGAPSSHVCLCCLP